MSFEVDAATPGVRCLCPRRVGVHGSRRRYFNSSGRQSANAGWILLIDLIRASSPVRIASAMPVIVVRPFALPSTCNAEWTGTPAAEREPQDPAALAAVDQQAETGHATHRMPAAPARPAHFQGTRQVRRTRHFHTIFFPPCRSRWRCTGRNGRRQVAAETTYEDGGKTGLSGTTKNAPGRASWRRR